MSDSSMVALAGVALGAGITAGTSVVVNIRARRYDLRVRWIDARSERYEQLNEALTAYVDIATTALAVPAEPERVHEGEHAAYAANLRLGELYEMLQRVDFLAGDQVTRDCSRSTAGDTPRAVCC
jgi:hypothetical protein